MGEELRELLVAPSPLRVSGGEVHEDACSRARHGVPAPFGGDTLAGSECDLGAPIRRIGVEAEGPCKTGEMIDMVLGPARRRRWNWNIVHEVIPPAGAADAPASARGEHELGRVRAHRWTPDQSIDHDIVASMLETARERKQARCLSAFVQDDLAHERQILERRRVRGRREHVDADVRMPAHDLAQHTRAHDHVAEFVVANEEQIVRAIAPIGRRAALAAKHPQRKTEPARAQRGLDLAEPNGNQWREGAHAN